MNQTRQMLGRLLQMRPREIAERCREQWRVWQERLAFDPMRRMNRSFDVCKSRALFNEFLTRPFYFAQPGDNRSTSVQSFQELFVARIETIVEEADQIRQGSIRLFGKRVTFPSGKIDWHLDWETDSRFPLQFYRSVTAPPGSNPMDPKRVWETNRQQYLLTLGKAYWLTREPRYAEEIVRIMKDWIASNPPYRGINWKESLELAMRLLSWVWALRMIANSEALTDAALHHILTSIAVQRDYIARHLSFYYSPNTHLLGEALALFVVNVAFPGIGSGGITAGEVLRILETELSKQVADDGSHREHSAYYHCYALDIYLLATILGQQYGIKFSEYWMRRLELMTTYLIALLRPDGSLARFGDDDGGRTLRLQDEDYYHPRSLVGVAAVLFGRGDFKHAAGELPEDVFWLCGENAAKGFLRLPQIKDSRKQILFPDAKIIVLRSGCGRDDAWLMCQGQPMGFLSAGHSHAALLSFELVLAGETIIVDPGTYSYEASSPWRDRFRSAEMHNVVEIDEKHFFVPRGPFGWEKIEALEGLEEGSQVSGSYGIGYKTGDVGRRSIQHVRTLSLESSRSASICDAFEGSGKHRLRFWLHFAPGISLQRRTRHEFEIELGDTKGEMTLKGFENFQFRSSAGTEAYLAGWYSPRYGVKVRSTTICIEEEVELPAERSFHFMCHQALKVDYEDPREQP